MLNFTKGIPTSLVMGSVQQWDKENAWPPMVHMVIEGFRTSGNPVLMKVRMTKRFRTFTKKYCLGLGSRADGNTMAHCKLQFIQDHLCYV